MPTITQSYIPRNPSQLEGKRIKDLRRSRSRLFLQARATSLTISRVSITQRPTRSNTMLRFVSIPSLIFLLPFTREYRSLKNTPANYLTGFIGKVDKHSELQLKTDYNRTHPPLDTRSVGVSFEDDTIHEEPEEGQ